MYLSLFVLGNFPSLKAFLNTWDVQFPLDPDIPFVIAPLLASREELPIRVIDQTEDTLTVTVYRHATKKRIKAAFETEIADYLPKDATGNRPVNKKRQWPIEYYQEIFRAYDLSQENYSNSEIAQRLWPDTITASKHTSAARNTHLQNVKDRIQAAKRLIDHAKK